MWQHTIPGELRLGEAPWWAVAAPVPDAPVWITWVRRQDATRRRFVASRGIWLFHPSLKEAIEARFIAVGWMVRYEMPNLYPHGDPQHKPGAGFTARYDPSPASPYDVLHVVGGAPRAVIDAAYKALMRTAHSDAGGDDDAAKALNMARDAIYQERGW